MRKILVMLVALAAVAITVPVAMGSGPAPEWVQVADGAYQAASVYGDGAIVYVPASTRLRPPTVVDDTSVPEVIEEEWGTGIPIEAVSPEATTEVVDERQAFVYYADPGTRAGAAALTTLPGGWSARFDGYERYLTSIADRLDRLAVAPAGQAYATYDAAGVLTVRDVHGETIPLPGLPQYVLDSAMAAAWSFDGTALYLAYATTGGAEVWLAPLGGQAGQLGRFDKFGGFVGATPKGVLLYQRGIALVEVTALGTRTVTPLASLDYPWAVSPDGRYVLWLDLIVSLTTVEDAKTTTLRMPGGYALCPPRGWPGPSSSEIVVYACGQDPSDTVLLWYSEEGPGRYGLRIVEPPSDGLCFDYSVDPVVVGPGVVSVVVTDRSAFLVGDAVDTGTWLIDLNGAGRR